MSKKVITLKNLVHYSNNTYMMNTEKNKAAYLDLRRKKAVFGLVQLGGITSTMYTRWFF